MPRVVSAFSAGTIINPLGIVGVNAAVANAVFHATGNRVRELPIRVEDLL